MTKDMHVIMTSTRDESDWLEMNEMKMIQRECTLRFHTPAFLGNAEQSGQWRTPPFKAQLRQWWRVAYAASKEFRPDEVRMREAEGWLFGNAWLNENFSKSLVRIRLAHWNAGSLPKNRWMPLDRIAHPEAPSAAADLYLGYGQIVLPRGERTPTLKANAAIQVGEENTFAIAFPDEHAPLIDHALALMNQFGAVGGRSRNGWGSYSLHGIGDATDLPLHGWHEALNLDWPHAIGCDANGTALIWQTGPFGDWKALMKALAEIKIGLRTQFKFPHAQPDGEIHERHWLSYPITRHPVHAWGNNARLPNSLRFKIRPTAGGKLVGAIFHMPCLPPKAFAPRSEAIKAVWQQVHAYLDQETTLTRTGA